MNFESLPVELISNIISFSCSFQLVCKMSRMSKTINETINNNFKEYISPLLKILYASRKIIITKKSNTKMLNCVKALYLDNAKILDKCKLLSSLINLRMIDLKIRETRQHKILIHNYTLVPSEYNNYSIYAKIPDQIENLTIDGNIGNTNIDIAVNNPINILKLSNLTINHEMDVFASKIILDNVDHHYICYMRCGNDNSDNSDDNYEYQDECSYNHNTFCHEAELIISSMKKLFEIKYSLEYYPADILKFIFTFSTNDINKILKYFKSRRNFIKASKIIIVGCKVDKNVIFEFSKIGNFIFE